MTAMTRAECEHLGCLATPEQIADAYAATGIPTAPDVRPAADELRRIEAMVEREFQKIEKPVAPDKPSERIENLWPYFAAACFVAGWVL